MISEVKPDADNIRIPEKWTIEFTGKKNAGELLSLYEGDLKRISVCLTNMLCSAELAISPYDSAPIILRGNTDGGTIRLCYTGNRVALYSGDTLLDENWPLGRMPDILSCKASAGAVISDNLDFDTDYITRGESKEIKSVEDYRPEGTESSCGDCMPYTDPASGKYRLFYLYDKRHHKSKHGLGAHQWAQISAADGKTWKTEPMAISIDEQWEGSICTGSIIENNGTYYAFYAVRMSDRSPAKLTYAVSNDCIHFKKTGKYFTLTEPYEPVSARDPKLFRDENGLFHMLVTTSVEKRGALAHLTSVDLESWEQRDPFVIMENSEQPECADYFSFGGYNYLVYSLYGSARYYFRKADSEPWSSPENNIVVTASLRVPKAAMLGNKLVFAGFVLDQGQIYGGHIELYEAKSSDNGILSFEKFKP